MLTQTSLSSGDFDEQFPIRERIFAPFLNELVAVNRGTTLQYVGHSTLEKWGVDELAVAEAAGGWLDRFADTLVELEDEDDGPLWTVHDEATLASSLLMVPGWLESFGDRVEGRPVAIIPERGTVFSSAS